MFWDASFDQNNKIGGRQYSEHIVSMFQNGGPRPSVNPATLDPSAGPPTVQTTAPTPRPTQGGSKNCKGIGPWTGNADMDGWCKANCAVGNCPSSICKCD